MQMLKNKYGRVVLITGASSGIGKATAQYLAYKGFRVYGTTRDLSRYGLGDVYDTQVCNCAGFFKLIHMDVCNEHSIKNAIDIIIKNEDRIDILINNAGIGIAGAIEDTSTDEAKKQFDTNFFGILTVCNKVLPMMRIQRNGLIINIGSVAGMISVPFQSMYSACKYALEAFSEALRIEVKPYGINVVLVDPGDTKTNFTKNRVYSEKSTLPSSPYLARFQKSVKAMENDEKNGISPEKVVHSIAKIISRKNPPIRTIVGMKYRVFGVLKRVLPSRLVELIVIRMYGFNKLKS